MDSNNYLAEKDIIISAREAYLESERNANNLAKDIIKNIIRPKIIEALVRSEKYITLGSSEDMYVDEKYVAYKLTDRKDCDCGIITRIMLGDRGHCYHHTPTYIFGIVKRILKNEKYTVKISYKQLNYGDTVIKISFNHFKMPNYNEYELIDKKK